MRQIVPAGNYFLGDPCYSFENHKKWLEILSKSDYFEEPYTQGDFVAVAFRKSVV